MSFKLKLVAYFLLVSLLPLGAAGWGLHALSRRSETRKVDVRLQARLSALVPAVKSEVAAAGLRARRLARQTGFQQALQRHDRAELRRLVAERPGVRLETDGLTLGPRKVL